MKRRCLLFNDQPGFRSSFRGRASSPRVVHFCNTLWPRTGPCLPVGCAHHGGRPLLPAICCFRGGEHRAVATMCPQRLIEPLNCPVEQVALIHVLQTRNAAREVGEGTPRPSYEQSQASEARLLWQACGVDPTHRYAVALLCTPLFVSSFSLDRVYLLALSICPASAHQPQSLEAVTVALDVYACTPKSSFTAGVDRPACTRPPRGQCGHLAVVGVGQVATEGEQVVRGNGN